MAAITADICVVGGCGRAGLPLGIAFAQAGCRVIAYDIDRSRVTKVQRGEMPFLEAGGEQALASTLASGCLTVTDDSRAIGRAGTVIVIIGTPVDEFLNPSMTGFRRTIETLAPQFRDGALVVLRSTVYPGTTEWLGQRLTAEGREIDVAFCPERIVEGKALEEIGILPQIVGADTPRALQRARELFARLVPTLIETTSREAELAKLLTNAWRYMKFAVANYFYMVANSSGVDYNRVLHAIRHEYPRARDLPSPGFAAGPCLLKDTMQLAAASQHNYMLGHAAMAVNEGLPDYVVQQVARRKDLSGRTVGILGMAFKAESDDVRASLSYKLKKLLVHQGAHVLCTDPLVKDDIDLVPLEQVLAESDILFIGAPHDVYRTLALDGRDVVDIWGAVSPAIRV
jgi:UDP-N-acetyl-D-mannosaminuronic acid dehydrogenase